MVKYKMEEVKGIPYEKQKRMAIWSKQTAKKVASKFRPLVGKRVILYGGGGWDYNVGRLKSIKSKPSFYYISEGHPAPKGVKVIKDPSNPDKERASLGYYSPKDYIVEADLRFKKEDAPFQDRMKFTPHLGSWKIAKLRKVI